ncbi:hypothetical protein AB0P21_12655 [Kribbella sp. NPDC056861]|uniref:hypothetical protein n=1 Tax=Kribbella sp. NPDC056861 TaxID=3154857 RepID=UPI0034159F80
MAEVLTCPCGVTAEQPWRLRDKLWSPASFIGGVLWLVLGAVCALAGFNPFGVVVLIALAVVALGSLVLQAFRGHRGSCLVRRGLWFGVAAPGLPVRIVTSLGF